MPSVRDNTAHLPALIKKWYDDYDVVATEGELVPSLLQYPGLTNHSRAVQERRSERLRPPTGIAAKDLSFEGQLKPSCFKFITRNEARAWQDFLPGRHELSPETRTLELYLWLQYSLGAAFYDL